MVKRSKRMNKRGSLVDLIFVGIVLTAIAITTLIVYQVAYNINDNLVDAGVMDSHGTDAMQDIVNMYPGVIDNSYMFLAMGVSLLILFLAMLVRIHPVFLVFFIILLAAVIFINGIFSNIYLEIANTPQLVDRADELTFTTLLIGRWPFIVGIFGFLLAIVQYKNWSDGT